MWAGDCGRGRGGQELGTRYRSPRQVAGTQVRLATVDKGALRRSSFAGFALRSFPPRVSGDSKPREGQNMDAGRNFHPGHWRCSTVG